MNINLLYGSWYWEDGPYSKTRIIFRNNGTYNTEDYELNNDNWEIVGSDQGTWDLIGNRLYIDMEYAATILSLTKDKLVFMEDGENFVCYRQ